MDIKIYGRLSFPALARPEAPKGTDNKRYSATILIDKGSADDKKIREAMKEVAMEKWGDKFTDKLWQRITTDSKLCFYTDGDLKDYPSHNGKMAAAAHSKITSRPSCFNQRREKLDTEEIEQLFYPGCYVYAVISIWAQDNQHGKGIRASLSGIQFAKNGESFTGSKVSDGSEFDVIEEDAAEDVPF